jgi:3-phosphoshikimate 1-carboxyvinyltransferase
MRERPIDDLLSPLRQLGVDIEQPSSGPWVIVKGPAKISLPQTLFIDCEKSTQFASALLLSFHDTQLSFSFQNLHASEQYLRMTQEMIKQSHFVVPVDFSAVGYPVALALVEGAVRIKNCFSLDPYQADSIFIELMKKSGAEIYFTSDGLYASSRNTLSPFAVDGSLCPDLVPTLAFLASRITGTSHLENLSVLRHKESDRLAEIIRILESFEVRFSFDSAKCSLAITGSSKRAASLTFTPARDHRMAMTAYLFMRANQGGMLANADCVNKSYPHFFSDMN